MHIILKISIKMSLEEEMLGSGHYVPLEIFNLTFYTNYNIKYNQNISSVSRLGKKDLKYIFNEISVWVYCVPQSAPDLRGPTCWTFIC